MGLESVELVLDMEDTFGISISDEEAEQIITPKHAISLIAKKVQIGDAQTCLTQTAFYRVRKVLVSEFGVERNSIKNESDLTKLIHNIDKHREFWEIIREETKIKVKEFPHLSRPTWVVYLAWAIFGVGTIYSGVMFGFVVGVIIGIALFAIVMFLTKNMAKIIPSHYKTTNKLVRLLVSRNPTAFKKNEQWTQTQIRELVKEIVMDVLGTEKYDEDWEFVVDFGIG